VRDGFVRHVGQQMLDRDFVEQPQLREHIQNNFKKRIHEIVLGEREFVRKN